MIINVREQMGSYKAACQARPVLILSSHCHRLAPVDKFFLAGKRRVRISHIFLPHFSHNMRVLSEASKRLAFLKLCFHKMMLVCFPAYKCGMALFLLHPSLWVTLQGQSTRSGRDEAVSTRTLKTYILKT